MIRDYIVKAIYDAMVDDPSIYILGEGAHMKVHFDAPFIERDFPERVVTLPISEDGNTDFAVGMSLLGFKPINDIISSDFLFRAMDGICNLAAKVNYFHRDDPKTIVIRAEFFTGGPTTGQRIESLFTHIPGLKVAVPSFPEDAYDMMKEALSNPGVTVFFEDRMVEDSKLVHPEPKNITPGKARVVTYGDKLTVVSYGLGVQRCLEAVRNLGAASNVELIDLRWLSPIDFSTIGQSFSKTRKMLMVEPGIGGIGESVGAKFAPLTRLFPDFDLIPVNLTLHPKAVPTEGEIAKAIEEMLY